MMGLRSEWQDFGYCVKNNLRGHHQETMEIFQVRYKEEHLSNCFAKACNFSHCLVGVPSLYNLIPLCIKAHWAAVETDFLCDLIGFRQGIPNANPYRANKESSMSHLAIFKTCWQLQMHPLKTEKVYFTEWRSHTQRDANPSLPHTGIMGGTSICSNNQADHIIAQRLQIPQGSRLAPASLLQFVLGCLSLRALGSVVTWTTEENNMCKTTSAVMNSSQLHRLGFSAIQKQVKSIFLRNYYLKVFQITLNKDWQTSGSLPC